MKVALLTSSRADYSIYYPLIKAMQSESFFDLHIIAFGTHISARYGETVNQILKDGFEVSARIDTMPDGDHPADIAQAMGKTMVNFSKVWANGNFDLIIAIGDRYEMFAACACSIPFVIPIAHIHGGEITLGAFDDTFRNAISQMATYHFATTERYRKRIEEMKGSGEHVYNTGALSIDNLVALPMMSITEFREKFKIDLSVPTILITFHPETVGYEKNEEYIATLIAALKEIKGYQLVITMPNADTMGNMIREQLRGFISESTNAIGVESLGTLGYLSCMKHCSLMLGNTSSGFVEAAFFPKYVVNLGERQTGRILTPNIYNCPIEKDAIIAAVNRFDNIKLPESANIYGDGTAAIKIIQHLITDFK